MDHHVIRLDCTLYFFTAAASVAIDARDAYTTGHSRRAENIVCKVIRELDMMAMFETVEKYGYYKSSR